jgi:hypothetical protein
LSSFLFLGWYFFFLLSSRISLFRFVQASATWGITNTSFLKGKKQILLYLHIFYISFL